MRKKKTPQLSHIPDLNALQQINLDAAGLDIGDDDIYACVPQDRANPSVRVFSTFTVDIHALADWLHECRIVTVALEATGVYWIPIFDILEQRGFELLLINPRQLKFDKKSDVLDCQWIQQLHSYGLLKGSFRPPDDIRTLRSLIRHRDALIASRAVHIQHMQKALVQMNIRLTNVLKDISGITGLRIIRDIIAGCHDPQALARHRDFRCHHSEDEIAKSLQGNYRPELIFVLRQALELFDFYTAQIHTCDDQIEHLYAQFDAQVDPVADPLQPPKRKRIARRENEPDFDLRLALYQMTGVDLTLIDGISALTAQTVLSETGTDMSRWATVKHFTSWLGLSPRNDISGGKVLKRGTRKTHNRASQALRMAALSLSRSDSALGAFYRRMRAKSGPQKAITATAHKLARIIYFMLKRREEYVDPGEAYYQEKYRQRIIHNLQRKAKSLGFQLVPVESET